MCTKRQERTHKGTVSNNYSDPQFKTSTKQLFLQPKCTPRSFGAYITRGQTRKREKEANLETRKMESHAPPFSLPILRKRPSTRRALRTYSVKPAGGIASLLFPTPPRQPDNSPKKHEPGFVLDRDVESHRTACPSRPGPILPYPAECDGSSRAFDLRHRPSGLF